MYKVQTCEKWHHQTAQSTVGSAVLSLLGCAVCWGYSWVPFWVLCFLPAVTVQLTLIVERNLKLSSYKYCCNLRLFELSFLVGVGDSVINSLFQIRNVGTGLCVDTKHGALGSPLRLENCVKDRGEAGWNNVQVTNWGIISPWVWAGTGSKDQCWRKGHSELSGAPQGSRADCTLGQDYVAYACGTGGSGAWQTVQSFYLCFEVLQVNKRNDKKTVCQNNKPVTRQL